MIRKFAAIPRCGFVLSAFLIGFLVAVGTVRAQQTPAQPPTADPSQPQQQPQTQQQPDQSSGSQEASPEDTIPGRRKKPRLYKKWTFNVGGGGSLLSGTTNTYVRGGGGVAEIGAARNYAEYFGLRGEFQFDNLPLRNSALQLAQAPGATSHAYAVMLGPVINIPATKNWGGFLLFGPAYVHRSGKLDSSTAVPGSACNGFYNWWGTCFNASLPLNGKFLNASENEFGEYFGFGITRKITSKVDLYAEYRYLHGAHSGITTTVRPITIGVRW